MFNNGLRPFAVHANDAIPRAARAALEAPARTVGTPDDALPGPEAAARSYLRQALAAESIPALTAPAVNGQMSEFKLLSVENLPLTKTRTVKFRQYSHKLPVYGTLVTVELDEDDRLVALNSSLGEPQNVDPVARLSPGEAVDRVRAFAGSTARLADATPRLCFYFDPAADRWRLVYIAEDVRYEPAAADASGGHEPGGMPHFADFVIDAHSGEVVAKLPRTRDASGPGGGRPPNRRRTTAATSANWFGAGAAADTSATGAVLNDAPTGERPAHAAPPASLGSDAGGSGIEPGEAGDHCGASRPSNPARGIDRPGGPNTEEAVDGLGRRRTVRSTPVAGPPPSKRMEDPELGVRTHDFNFQNVRFVFRSLPGRFVANPPAPWSPAAVSAHANAADVARFLREVLVRRGVDDRNAVLVSSVNCVDDPDPAFNGREWRNAAWLDQLQQMVYGQRQVGNALRSYAVGLDVVGHEVFHGVTSRTARLQYLSQSGALDESFADVFGVMISNWSRSDIADWNWEIGEELSDTGRALRDLRRPERFGQPAHMDDYVDVDPPYTEANDFGGVHTNSGVHNQAAYRIMTARADGGGGGLFTPRELATLFYYTVLNHLSRTSGFADSRRGMRLVAESLFRNDPAKAAKLRAISKAFDDVGIAEAQSPAPFGAAPSPAMTAAASAARPAVPAHIASRAALEDEQPGSRYQRVIRILDNSIGGPGANIGVHGAFWRGLTRDQFVTKQVLGQDLVQIGVGAASNLVKALKGESPFGIDLDNPPDDAQFSRMPAARPPVSDEDIGFIRQWIDDGCPDSGPGQPPPGGDATGPTIGRRIDLPPPSTPPVLSWRPTNAPIASSRTDDVFFLDPQVGWAVNSNGQIIHTTNGGDSWTVQFHDEAVYFRCIAFASPTRGWAGTLTAAKRLFETRDGGRTWTLVANLPRNPTAICGLSLVSESVVYASGTNYPNRPTGIIKTVDGGKTWRAIDMHDHADNLIDIYFTSPDRGWVVGGKTDQPPGTRENGKAVVLYTEDGGASWVNRAQNISASLPRGEWGWKIQFLDDRVGFVSLENFDDGAILATTDGGLTWERRAVNDPQRNANLEGIGFVDAQHGWVGGWGDRDFQRRSSSETFDGGRTWRDANEIGRAINRFRFFGNPVMVGYASGETVYKYTTHPAAPLVVARAVSPFRGGRLLEALAPLTTPAPAVVPVMVPAGAKRLTVRIWDRFGEQVRVLVDDREPAAGRRGLKWDRTDENGRPLPPGYYIWRVTVDGESESRLVQILPSRRRGRATTIRLAAPASAAPAPGAIGRAASPADAVARALSVIRPFEVPAPHNQSPIAEARYLLTAAAEIEHGLLVQYLYAAYSLSSAADAFMFADGRNMRDRLIEVAVEEMGHLLNVQNLLLLLGDRPYLDRENYTPDTRAGDLYPFPFLLEPLDRSSLAKYVSAESPLPETISDLAKREKVAQIIRAGKGSAGSMINHVGVLYAQLYWLFQSGDAPEEPWTMLPERVKRPGWHIEEHDLAGSANVTDRGAQKEFGFGGLAERRFLVAPATLAQARELIDRIAEQGEGMTTPASEEDDSHFEWFLSAYEQWDTFIQQAGGSPARAVPSYPNTATAPHADPQMEAGRITYAPSRAWAALFNVRYQMLLHEISLMMWQSRATPESSQRRGVLRSLVMNGMRDHLKSLALRLVELPRRERAADGSVTIFAGPPFELADHELPRDEPGLWTSLGILLDRSAILVNEINGLEGPDAPTDANLFGGPTGLARADERLRALFSQT